MITVWPHYWVVSRVSHLHQNFHTYNSSGLEDLHVVSGQKFYPYRGQILRIAEEGLRTGSKERLTHYYFSYSITGYCDASLMAYRIIADRRFRGWGKESYQKLLNAIGNDEALLWHALETQQEASPSASITDLKWQRLLEGWRCVRLQDALINAGFDGKSIVRFFQQYDVLAYDIFKRHPFKVLLYCDPRTLLLTVNKLYDFLRHQELPPQLSFSRDFLKSQYEHAVLSAAFAQAMSTYSTAFPRSEIEQLILEGSTLKKPQVQQLLQANRIEHFSDAEGLPLVQLGAVQRTEDVIVALLRQINHRVKPLKTAWQPLTVPQQSCPSAPSLHSNNLSGDQVKAVFEHGISIIAGGAGSGKSHCVFQLIPEALALGFNVICAALSNVAVHRLREGFKPPKGMASAATEASRVRPVDPVRFMSLAKLTRINHEEETAPLLIFIDEASMLGAGLLWKLLTALRSCHVQLVLLGDPQQLPPIGWGSIFHQLLESDEAFHIRLTGDWRKQDTFSGSLENPVRSQLIAALDSGEDAAFDHIEGVFFPSKLPQATLSNEDLLEFLFAAYCSSKSGLQIVCCTSADCDAVNTFFERKQLQKLRAEKIHGGNNYQVGDPVINTINRAKLEIWNGDIGHITRLPGKKGLSAVFQRQSEAADEASLSISIPIDRGIQYAYAITVHKAQGMGFQNVGFYLSGDSDPTLLHRGMIYTVITRFYDQLFLAASPSALIEGWKRKNPVAGARSFTALKERK